MVCRKSLCRSTIGKCNLTIKFRHFDFAALTWASLFCISSNVFKLIRLKKNTVERRKEAGFKRPRTQNTCSAPLAAPLQLQGVSFEGGSSFTLTLLCTLVVGASARQKFKGTRLDVKRKAIDKDSCSRTQYAHLWVWDQAVAPSRKITLLISQEECDETREKSVRYGAHPVGAVCRSISSNTSAGG